MTSEFVMPVNEHIGGLTVLDKGLDARQVLFLLGNLTFAFFFSFFYIF